MLQVFYNGSDHVIAESEDDAAKVWEEVTGDSWRPYADDGEEWVADNHEVWTINYEDEDDRASDAPKDAELGRHENNGYFYAKATQQQWIEKSGRGWLCSENW